MFGGCSAGCSTLRSWVRVGRWRGLGRTLGGRHWRGRVSFVRVSGSWLRFCGTLRRPLGRGCSRAHGVGCGDTVRGDGVRLTWLTGGRLGWGCGGVARRAALWLCDGCRGVSAGCLRARRRWRCGRLWSGLACGEGGCGGRMRRVLHLGRCCWRSVHGLCSCGWEVGRACAGCGQWSWRLGARLVALGSGRRCVGASPCFARGFGRTLRSRSWACRGRRGVICGGIVLRSISYVLGIGLRRNRIGCVRS